MTAPRLARAVARASRAESVSERIYRQLKESIFEFRLLPGDRVTETELAELTHASRTPVREALARLQREGFVKVAFRSGWQICPFDFEQFEQLYDVRIALELAAVARLCTCPANLADLHETWLVAPSLRLNDGARLCELDERFHERLVEASGNIEMAVIHRQVCERLRIVRRLDFAQAARIEATYEEHGRILQSIEAGQCEAAQLLLRQHIEQSKAVVRQITLHSLFDAQRKLTPTMA